MTYGKKRVHNIATGEIEFIDLTSVEMTDRDALRAMGASDQRAADERQADILALLHQLESGTASVSDIQRAVAMLLREKI